MKTETVIITPAMALQWLEHNTINRPLRPSVVEGLRSSFERGEYLETHQGIAFAESGELLDGQHRLTAISQMPDNFKCTMLVAYGLNREAFKAIDIGVKRSPGDVLRINHGLAAVCRFMATIVETGRVGITPQMLVPYVAGVEAVYAHLVSFTPKATKTWSSAAIRTAACLQTLAGGDRDYISISYHALNHAEFDAMSPAIQTLYRQQLKGTARASGFDMFCRAFKAFDVRQQAMDRIQISDSAAMIGRARDIINAEVLGNRAPGKKAAPVASAAKKAGAKSTAKA